MDPIIEQQVKANNACTNCGANLEYDFTTNSYKCPYCGSSLKTIKNITNTANATPDTGCIPFRNDISQFREAAANFLSSGDKTPVNLLFEATFLPAEQLYLPFYQFSGTYSGYYNTLDENGEMSAQNTPLTDKFSVSAYGGTDNIDGKAMTAFADRTDKKLIIPISTIDIDNIRLTDSQSDRTVWDNWGQLQASAQVYRTLHQAAPSYKHQHYLKYHIQSASKFYYPTWRIVYCYQGNNYVIYMDDVTNELNADKPEDLRIEPPKRSAVYKKYLLIGLCLWLGMLILRAALAAFVGGHFDIEDHYLNNIIFSEATGLYWLLRGLIFLGILPLLMITIFYKKIAHGFYARLAQIRRRNLDLLASGKKTIAFSQANNNL